jgi:hypothetical protein
MSPDPGALLDNVARMSPERRALILAADAAAATAPTE